MKIAIFSDTYRPQVNGVITTINQTVQNLVGAGHQVFLFTVSKNSAKELETEFNGQVKIFLLPSLAFWGYKGERFSIPLGWTMLKIRAIRPDIIHLHTPFAVGWEAIISAKLFKIPVVGTHHTFFDHYLAHIKLDYAWVRQLSWKVTAIFYNRCDLLLCPSKALISQLQQHGLTINSGVLSNPVDCDFFKPIDSPEAKNLLKRQFKLLNRALIYMGRLSYEKSLDQVIEAFAQVVKVLPETRLVLVGDGPEKAKLLKLASALNLEDKIIFTGYLFKTDLLKILQAGDIFISASKSENQPTSFLESMAAGLPVIAADASGTPEVIKNNQNGYLFTPDQPTEFAEKIISLLDSPDKLASFSLASRQLAYQHSNQQVTAELLDYYQGLIK